MGKFDEYYMDHAKREATKRIAAQKVASYNYLVAHAQALIDAIMQHVHAGNLPTRCNWVYDRGPKLVSWRIQRGDGGKYSYNLLADEGRLAYIQRMSGPDGGFNYVVLRVSLESVKADTDIWRRDIDLPDLHGVVGGLVRLRLEPWKKISL